METMQYETTKSGKRKWKLEQKLAILREIESGANQEEVCRKYGIIAQDIYRWRKSVEKAGREGLRHNGNIVPHSQYMAVVKKVEELERALGRKSLEVDILKKTFEIKGLKLPEGM